MSLPNIPDHPDIACAERYGYPCDVIYGQHEEEVCHICGAPADCWGYDDGYLCFDCAREQINEMSNEEIADMLGMEVLND